jgi:hypothetical protein
MDYPQIVGLKCWRCDKAISSITEGQFCPSCCNPMHLKCRLPEGSAVAEERCSECGADPQSPLARKVRAEVEERAAAGPRVICPNCGSTHGFRPFRTDASPNPAVLLLGAIPYLLMWMVGASAQMGELECFKCQYIFRPRSRVREIGCIIMIVLGLAAVVALSVFGS